MGQGYNITRTSPQNLADRQYVNQRFYAVMVQTNEYAKVHSASSTRAGLRGSFILLNLGAGLASAPVFNRHVLQGLHHQVGHSV